MKRLTKYQMKIEIMDLLGADCSKHLSTFKLNELEQWLSKLRKENPTIELHEGYKGKHKVTFISWLDTNGRKYKTDVYQIEVVNKNDVGKRIQFHKDNFTENTIIFWFENHKVFGNGFRGTHIFKHSAEQKEAGVWYGGSGHKVFSN
jgi:hypothetical protein